MGRRGGGKKKKKIQAIERISAAGGDSWEKEKPKEGFTFVLVHPCNSSNTRATKPPPPPDGLDVVALKLTAIYPSLSLPLRGRHNGRAADNVTMLTGRIYSDAPRPTLSLFPLLPLFLFLSLPLPTT